MVVVGCEQYSDTDQSRNNNDGYLLRVHENPNMNKNITCVFHDRGYCQFEHTTDICEPFFFIFF